MQKGAKKKSDVQGALVDFVTLCDELRGIHGPLMGMLPDGEKEKHYIWFKAKIMFNDECISDAKRWVGCSEQQVCKDDGDDDDSVSNVASKHSSRKMHAVEN